MKEAVLFIFHSLQHRIYCSQRVYLEGTSTNPASTQCHVKGESYPRFVYPTCVRHIENRAIKSPSQMRYCFPGSPSPSLARWSLATVTTSPRLYVGSSTSSFSPLFLVTLPPAQSTINTLERWRSPASLSPLTLLPTMAPPSSGLSLRLGRALPRPGPPRPGPPKR